MGCRHGIYVMETSMEPMNLAGKGGNSKDTSPQTLSSPLDADDYFELACEADEFGVHILLYSVAE
jgi:hypothetical protein